MSTAKRAFRAAVVTVFTLAVAFTSSCGSGFLDGLSGGTRESAGDAGSPSSPDALDGASQADAPAPGCAASFCDDFDHGPLGARWSDSGVTAGASIALVGGGLSAPNAFRAAYEGGLANTEAELEKQIGGHTKIHCELDLQLVSPPQVGEVDYLAYVSTTAEVKVYRLYFATFDGAWNLGEYAVFADGGKIDRSKDMPAPALGRWTHVAFDTNGDSLSIAFDGSNVATLPSLTHFEMNSREVHVGITFASGNATSSAVLYDNVACDYPL